MLKTTILALLCLAAATNAMTTTSGGMTTTDATTMVDTTTEGTTTEEMTTTPLRCGFDRDLSDNTGINLFDAKFERTKFDDEGDRDFGLKCGKTDTNDYSFQWMSPKNDWFGIDVAGECKTWVQVRDSTKKCKGDVLACDKDGVNLKADKGSVYAISVYGRKNRNDYKCKFSLSIRRGCKLPYMDKDSCEAKCWDKSVRHVTKKGKVYWPELVMDGACPKCLCHKVRVPETTTTKAPTTTKATTAATTEAPSTTRRRRRTTTAPSFVCPEFRPCNCKEPAVNVSYYDSDGCEVDCGCVNPSDI